MKIIITLALLFSFAFSTVHEFAFAFYDEEHCSVSEYVDEINAPSEHDDICDTHFEYHHAFILPIQTVSIYTKNMTSKPNLYKEEYKFLADLNFIKPPIS
jgi:hypothetical protein